MIALPTRSRSAVVMWIAIVVLSAPVGVALSLAYRSAFALESWVLGSPYPLEELEFLQPDRIAAAILWTYLICAVPVIATASALAWRTWKCGAFSYAYSAIVSAAFMAIYMVGAVYVFRRELVRVVTVDSAVSGVVYAAVVSLVVTAVLRYAGLAISPER